MSIKRKLTLMMMGITLAAVLLTVLAITSYLIYDMRKSQVKELAVMAAITGDRNSAALLFSDLENARRNLDIFRLNPAILTACIYNQQGELFAGYIGSDSGDSTGCAGNPETVSGMQHGKIVAYEQITRGGESIGHVYMASDTREIDVYVKKILLISATVVGVVLAASLLLTYYFQRAISGPILDLASTASAITAKRDYTLEAKVSYPGETGVLARAFNDMVSEVRKRDQELREANETLEQKVTDRTRKLEESMRKAEAANEAKSEFLRNMSHEFRTPLHAIISFASYGVKEHDSAARSQLKRYYELIQLGADRLSRLVGEVLDLAKLERGEHMFLMERGRISDITERASDVMKSLAEEKKLTLVFDHATPAATLVCDHDKIVQVITNLLSNAIKFTPAGKIITLHTHISNEDSGPQAIISVTDEGMGVPAGEEEMIFESFRQSSRTNTGAGGTGLGLAISRGIVTAHGGRIWAKNNVGGPGACVTFIIPALAQEGKRLVTMNTNANNGGHHEHAA